jgi:predicted phage terminase large subunit-like protein
MASPTSIVERFLDKVKAKASLLTKKQMGLIEWGKHYVPHYFTRKSAAFHFELAAELDRLVLERDQKVVVVIPRGYAKSTITTFLKALKSICEGTERYILIGSKNEKLASKYLNDIKKELEENELLRKDYPTACEVGAAWNSERIETGNDVCCEIYGKGSGVRGRKYKQYRPSLIILDDPQETDDVNSPTVRENDIEWMKRSLFPVGDTGTNIFVVGNDLHVQSMVGWCTRNSEFKCIKYSAIEVMPTRMDLWDEWEQRYISCYSKEDKVAIKQFYLEHQTEMDSGAKILWPEKESLYDLMSMRASGHAAFDAEKQNNPRDPSRSEFESAWFPEQNPSLWYDTLPTDIHKVVIGYNDPSLGKKAKSRDYSPILTGHFVPEHGCMYLECDVRKIAVTTLTDSIIDWHKAVHYDFFGIESNGFQQLLSEELYAKLMEQGIALPIAEVQHYGVQKNTRISSLSIWLKRGFLRFKRNCPYTRILLQQLQDHPFADHDDASDALQGLIKLLCDVTGLDSKDGHEYGEADDGLGDNLLGN